jgi:ADP-ribose pyrophosphatase YjhB (NUDIX family)
MSEIKRYGGIIVKHKDKVLLCKRGPKESLPNEWSIPSGHLEKGEDPIEGALREFKEETNLKINGKLDLVGLLHIYKNNLKNKKGVMFVFYYNSKSKLIPDLDKAKDGHEHTDCNYFDKNEIPINRNNDQLKKIIEKIFK